MRPQPSPWLPSQWKSLGIKVPALETLRPPNIARRASLIDHNKKAGNKRNVPSIPQCLRSILLRESEELRSLELEKQATLALHWMIDDLRANAGTQRTAVRVIRGPLLHCCPR